MSITSRLSLVSGLLADLADCGITFIANAACSLNGLLGDPRALVLPGAPSGNRNVSANECSQSFTVVVMVAVL